MTKKINMVLAMCFLSLTSWCQGNANDSGDTDCEDFSITHRRNNVIVESGNGNVSVKVSNEEQTFKDIEIQVYKDGNLLIDDFKQGVSDDMNDTYPIPECENGDYEVIVIEDNEITAVENITVE